jgi:hypothetical protein
MTKPIMLEGETLLVRAGYDAVPLSKPVVELQHAIRVAFHDRLGIGPARQSSDLKLGARVGASATSLQLGSISTPGPASSAGKRRSPRRAVVLTAHDLLRVTT